MSAIVWSMPENSLSLLDELAAGQTALDIYHGQGTSKRAQGFRNTVNALQRRGMLNSDAELTDYGRATLQLMRLAHQVGDLSADKLAWSQPPLAPPAQGNSHGEIQGND